MKLKQYKAERRGDRLSLSGSWIDEMKRPASVSFDIKRGAAASEGEEVIVDAAVADVDSVLSELAEVAWERGWRPRGLMGTVASFIQKYKLPPRDM